jgi:hypothetical protein
MAQQRGVMSYVSTRTSRPTTPGLHNLLGLIDRDMLAELRRVSAELSVAGIRHALIGGHALGVYGYVRATGDADFLIGREATERTAQGEPRPVESVLRITESADVPIDAFAMLEAVPGARASLLSALDDALDHPFITEGVPVVPAAVLIALKLVRGADEDLADVRRLLRTGLVDRDAARAFVVRHLEPTLVDRFDALAAG